MLAVREGYEVGDRPVYAQDGALKLALPEGLAGLRLPDDNEAGLVSAGEVGAVLADGQASDCAVVAHVGDVEGGGERPKSRGIRQFGDESIWINVQFLLLDPGA